MSVKQVAIVVKNFPSVSQTFIVNQINSLIEIGLEVHLFAYQKGDIGIIHESIEKHDLLCSVRYFIKPPVSKFNRLGVFIKWIFQHFVNIRWRLLFKCLNFFRHGKDAYTLKLFFEAQWFLVPYHFDIIHTHFGMNGNRIAYLKSFGIIPTQIKLINTFHGYDLVPNKLQDYKDEYKYLLQEANAFTVNTVYLENLLRQINIFNKPCFILPVGLDTSYFKKRDAKNKKTYFDIVFCGRLITLKGPDLAIEIVKILHELDYTHVRLHILGDGPLRSHLENQVNDFNLKQSVIFYGRQSQESVINYFNQSDVFLLPGRYDPETGRAETQGLVIQEAQAMKLPVLVSDVGGMAYGLLPNESGYVIKEGDVNGFVDAVEKFILNPKLAKDMGIKGRQFVKKYDNKILGEKLKEIYMLMSN